MDSASTAATAITVTGTASYSAATGKTTYGGSVAVMSDTIRIYAGVVSVAADYVKVGTRNVHHAIVTSTSFVYRGVKCHVVIDMMQVAPLGAVGFQIVPDTGDQSPLAATYRDGLYQPLGFEWGGVSIF